MTTPGLYRPRCLQTSHPSTYKMNTGSGGTDVVDKRKSLLLPESKSKSSPLNSPRRLRSGVEVKLYSFFDLGCRWEGVNSKPRLRYHRERDSVPTVQEAWWAPRPVWTGVKNVASTRIRFPDRRSDPLRRYIYFRNRTPSSLSHNLVIISGCSGIVVCSL